MPRRFRRRHKRRRLHRRRPRFMRRFRRFHGRRGKAIRRTFRIPGRIDPDIFNTKLRWQAYIATGFDGTSGGAAHAYRTSVWDPDPSLGTGGISAVANLNTRYNYVKVNGAKVTITCGVSNTDTNMRFGILFSTSPELSPVTQYLQLQEIPGGFIKERSTNRYKGPITFSKYMSTKKVLGQRSIIFNSPNWWSTVNSNPSAVMYMHIYQFQDDGQDVIANTATMVNLRITYYCTFSVMKKLADTSFTTVPGTVGNDVSSDIPGITNVVPPDDNS